MRCIMTATVLCALLAAGVSLAPARSEPPSRTNGGQPAGAPQDHISELLGTVQAVDREVKALRVSQHVGNVPETMLLIADDTEVRVQGRVGSLADIQQGTRIRASYQARYGINLARSIEITG
jgi:hypothetical protein